MTGVLVIICIIALLYSFIKVDLTNIVFGKIGTPEHSNKAMSNAQIADIMALWQQQNSEKQSAAFGPDKQIVEPMQQVEKNRPVLPPTNELGSVFKYIDSNGMIVMVDDLNKVPAKYRSKMKTSSSIYGQQRTTVKVLNNQIWVPVTFGHKGGGATAWLLLDTGATNTSISPALARRLGVHPADTTRGNAKLADGRMVQTAHVVVDQVTVGPKVKRYLNVQIMPRAGNEETGLLGMNFLEEFPYIVEARAGTIRWQ